MNLSFLCRTCLAALFVIVAHQLRWDGLRFLTSEAILRLSAAVGMITARASLDTIQLQGQRIRFVVACTFVDVFAGSIPLMWRANTSLLKNLLRIALAAGALFGFNIVRLEIGQILYAHGVSWTLAHEVLGGFAYFAVWLVIWWRRDWHVLGVANSAGIASLTL